MSGLSGGGSEELAKTEERRRDARKESNHSLGAPPTVGTIHALRGHGHYARTPQRP